MKRLIPFFLIEFILVVIIFVLIFLKSYLNERVNSKRLVFIPKGSITQTLLYLDKNFSQIGFLDRYLIPFLGHLQAGWIDLESESLTRAEFLYKLTHSKMALKSITLIPGETKEIFFHDLSKWLDLNVTILHQEYDKLAPYPDGVLVANTYKVPIDIDEKSLIKFLIDYSLNWHKEISLKFLNRYDQKEWFEKYVTIASIIHKEAVLVEEMKLISAVIYNRLKIGMKLQMDGALNYGKYSRKKITSRRIREDNSKFNTYKIPALPPHPICSINEDSIMAALFPADVNYLYFVKTINNRHLFTNSYKEHLKNIQKLRSVK